MKKLDIYIVKLHVLPFLGALLTLTLVLLLDKLFDLMNMLITKGVPLNVVLKLFLYALPFILALSIPMSMLVSTLIVFGQLSHNFEITAAKACGISLKRLMVGPLIMALFVSVFMVWFYNTILPESNHRFKNLLIDIYLKKPSAQIEAGLFNTIGNYKLYVRNKDDRTSRMEDIRIYDLSQKGERFITAKYGYIKNIQDSFILFTLYDGEINEVYNTIRGDIRRVSFHRYDVLLKLDIGMKIRERHYRGDREKNLSMLLDEIERRKMELERKNLSESTRKYIQNRINALWVEVHKKFAMPFGALVFALLGAPLSSMIRKGGFGVALGISFVVFTIYYVALIGGEELAKRGYMDPALSMWLPNILFTLISIYLIYKEERVV